MIRIVRSLAVLVLMTLPAAAQPAGTYILDKAHSSIRFSIGHFYVSNTEGQFNEFDGKLTLSRNDRGPRNRFAVTVNISPGSIETDSAARDDHLRTADFFDVAKFPSASFVGAVAVEGDTAGKLTGTFILHGVTKPVTLDVRLMSPDMNGATLDFAATGTVKRSDFGITSYPGVIGDDVKLTIVAQFDRN
jgi:polyisoprenoid-binding protein YceI